MRLGKLVRPRNLQRGDTPAAVILSWGGPSAIRERHEIGKRQLEDTFGVRLIGMTHTCADADFIAENPQVRAQDLHNAFSDPGITGIISSIGGADSIPLLPYLD